MVLYKQKHFLFLAHTNTLTYTHTFRSLPILPTFTHFLSFLIKNYSLLITGKHMVNTQSHSYTQGHEPAVSGFQSRKIFFFSMDTGVLWWFYPLWPHVVIVGYNLWSPRGIIHHSVFVSVFIWLPVCTACVTNNSVWCVYMYLVACLIILFIVQFVFSAKDVSEFAPLFCIRANQIQTY